MINLTPKQEAWFAALSASLERDTGRTLAAWIDIVHDECPETTRQGRAGWLKTHHGLPRACRWRAPSRNTRPASWN